MNMPGFYANASLYGRAKNYRGTSNGSSGSGLLVRPSSFRIPHIPISISPGVDWGCYEICAQHCSFSQNLQACQRNCLNQCARYYPTL
jgi:hypothetical protein